MEEDSQKTLIVQGGEGRCYELGAMKALFLADEAETASRYSISEWWLEPGCEGVGAHSHEGNDDIFYVLEGSPCIFVGETWHSLTRGGFVRVPAGVLHDFRNRTAERAGLLNIYIPGGFERDMAKIVDWFEHQA